MSRKKEIHPFEWDVHTQSEKTKARRWVALGWAVILRRYHETYIKKVRGKTRHVNYEAWAMQLDKGHPDYNKE